MKEFDFRFCNFRTTYRAVPADQTYLIFAGNEQVTFFEQSEMQQMIAAGKIFKMFDKEEENEVAK